MSKHHEPERPFLPGTPWGLFRFETPDAGAPAVADPAPADTAPADPAPADPPADTTTPAAAAGLDLSDPTVLAAIQQAVAPMIPHAGHDDQADGQPAPLELDPFADDFGQRLVGTIQQVIQQAVAPLHEHQQSTLVDQGKQEALEKLGGFEDLGEFDRNAAFAKAQDIFGGYVEQFGPQAEMFADRALRQAAEQQAEYERGIENRGIERYKKELETAAGRGGGDLPASGSGGDAPTTAKSYEEVIGRWSSRGTAAGAQL